MGMTCSVMMAKCTTYIVRISKPHTNTCTYTHTHTLKIHVNHSVCFHVDCANNIQDDKELLHKAISFNQLMHYHMML
jgi:hypothetical protein